MSNLKFCLIRVTDTTNDRSSSRSGEREIRPLDSRARQLSNRANFTPAIKPEARAMLMYRETLNRPDRERATHRAAGADTINSRARADYFCARSYQSRNVSHFFVCRCGACQWARDIYR